MAIPLNDGALVEVEVAIAVGVPMVGSVSYNFQVAEVPNIPAIELKARVPVVTP